MHGALAKQGLQYCVVRHSERGMGFGGFSCCTYQVLLHRETVENNEGTKSPTIPSVDVSWTEIDLGYFVPSGIDDGGMACEPADRNHAQRFD